MLFNAATLDGLVEGTVTATYRRWGTPRARPGSRFTTRAGVVEVVAVTKVDGSRLSNADAGLPRAYYKIRVRRLKALGLTESLEVGYRLSPRGAAYLAWLDTRRT